MMKAGIECVAYDVNPDAVAELAKEGAIPASSIEDFVSKLEAPKTVWMMVPVAFVEGIIDQLEPLLGKDDILIDGGNSYYRDDIRRGKRLKPKGIHYVDIGVSGGVWGLERGFCHMIGGDVEAVAHIDPACKALAPGQDTAPLTEAREGKRNSADEGYLHCGPTGAGHFVKMVHNGIEYGIMSAYAEGLNILKHANVGKEKRTQDAETTPLRDPEAYMYDINLPDVAEVWRRGSVIGSWLLDLTASALAKNPSLEDFTGRVSDSGEGRWTLEAAIDESIPAPVLSAALFGRFSSRGEALFADKVMSAQRFEFGGHHEKKA
ncbi:MAG: decarboxylating 6-phosphogluconate dehydrogenase [Phycisphaerales bacterium]|nr:decarboxylating 6-phosphogluconate dehydrogenase [Phycisphaerales bacterium]